MIAYLRKAERREDLLIVICNFTPSPRSHYRINVPYRNEWKEIFSSDETDFGGSGVLNHGLLMTSPVKFQGKDYSISLTLPPLAVTVLKLEREINEFDLSS